MLLCWKLVRTQSYVAFLAFPYLRFLSHLIPIQMQMKANNLCFAEEMEA